MGRNVQISAFALRCYRTLFYSALRNLDKLNTLLFGRVVIIYYLCYRK